MIGVISVVIVLAVVLIVTLSGGKKLKCTMEDKNGTMFVQLTFNGDKVKYIKVLAEQDISDLDDDEIKDLKKGIAELQDKGININYKITSKKIKMELSENSKEVAKAITKLSGYDSNYFNMSYDLVKAVYEKNGMTCK